MVTLFVFALLDKNKLLVNLQYFLDTMQSHFEDVEYSDLAFVNLYLIQDDNYPYELTFYPHFMLK